MILPIPGIILENTKLSAKTCFSKEHLDLILIGIKLKPVLAMALYIYFTRKSIIASNNYNFSMMKQINPVKNKTTPDCSIKT